MTGESSLGVEDPTSTHSVPFQLLRTGSSPEVSVQKSHIPGFDGADAPITAEGTVFPFF